MAYITGLTKGKKEWIPQFIKSIDEELCIGCGRCFKVCGNDVLALEEIEVEDSVKMISRIENDANCIGCQACGRTCSKKCFTFEPAIV